MAFVHVQGIDHNVFTIAGNSGTSAAFPAIGKGNTFVGVINSSDIPLSITDSAGNTYTIGSSVQYSTFTVFQTLFYRTNIQGSPTTFTANFNFPPTFLSATGDEYSGIAAFNTSNGAYSASATSPTSVALTTTVNGCLVWGYTNYNDTTESAGSSFTIRINDTANKYGTEDLIQGTAGAINVQWQFTGAVDRLIFGAAFTPLILDIGSDVSKPPRRKSWRAPPQQDDRIQNQTRFQTFTPPIGFDEDRGIQSRRKSWRAHSTPLEDTWIQQQTLFQTTTPPIGFDEDRGIQSRRKSWRAHPQPDYPEQQPVTQFQTFTPPIGFDEDRGRQIRRSPFRAHPDILLPSDFRPDIVFVPIGFDEDRGHQVRRTAWRQHTQAVIDDWILPPTIFVPIGFDEDRGRLIRRPPIAHPQPQDDWLQPSTAAPNVFVNWGFDEEQHAQIRRPSWRQRIQDVTDDFIQTPTIFVPLGFDEDRGIQARRAPWRAHPQPQDDWLSAFPVEAWGFDEEQHAQIRRPSWRAHPQPQEDWLTALPVEAWGFDEEQHFQIRRRPWRAFPQPQDDWLASIAPPATFVSWGFDEEQHFQIRRASWRPTSATKQDVAGDFPFVPRPPPTARAQGNVIFGVIRNLF